MVNEYCWVPQWEAARTLAAVAQGLGRQTGQRLYG